MLNEIVWSTMLYRVQRSAMLDAVGQGDSISVRCGKLVQLPPRSTMLNEIAWSPMLYRLQRSAMLNAVGQGNCFPVWREARSASPSEHTAQQDRLERIALQAAAERNALRSRVG